MRKIFKSSETFGASRLAEKWCDDQGISYGSSQADGPQGLLFGDYQIAKWRNLTAKERKQLHGMMDGDGRTGPITVYIKPEYEGMLKPEAEEGDRNG